MVVKGEVKVVLGIAVVLAMLYLSFLFGQSSVNLPEIPQSLSQPVNKSAILDIYLKNYGENIYNSSEMYYEVIIYNYGNTEATNVKATCKIYDEDGNILISKITNQSVPNIASRSQITYDIVTKNIIPNSYSYYIPFCYVESCENCEILYKKIPELAEAYEYD